MATTAISVYSPATAMLQALRERQVSAVELLDLHLRQVERYNEVINTIVTLDAERARETAAECDAALERGDERPLLGLPVTIKDAIDVAGLPTTGGMPKHADRRPEADAPVVSSIRAAGGVIFAKTNVPDSGDWQASNKLFGTTNNPWNLTLTSGGSTGGAAAVATGMSPLEIGSDIGGSVRIPASYCGIFSHKPSETAVPKSNLPNPAIPLTVQGPLARSAADLELALDIISGPVIGEDAGWRLEIPAPRAASLDGFRVAILPRLAWLPTDDETLAAQDRLAEQLSRAGATVGEAAPEGCGDFREYYAVYMSLLNAIVTRGLPDEIRARSIERLRTTGGEFDAAKALGMEATIGNYIAWHEQRERYRAAYRAFFREWDVLVTPVTVGPAYPHTTERWLDRRLNVNGQEISYDLLSAYPSLATLCGQPATSFPTGLSSDGLPLGLQAIGPYLEDRTSLRFARLVEQEFGGFQAPPEFQSQ